MPNKDNTLQKIMNQHMDVIYAAEVKQVKVTEVLGF